MTAAAQRYPNNVVPAVWRIPSPIASDKNLGQWWTLVTVIYIIQTTTPNCKAVRKSERWRLNWMAAKKGTFWGQWRGGRCTVVI
ncbi:hypothetical protein OJAV_G00058670 [Oryzias javanicus]|uniref:Uncharacterized protein n=1 Tax=Oryzias javanicus TaxID=123683 RepID=A0A3S2PCQ8_ORYJA|nr:hypothetical protein OJAV_G00058670 [Oryzias javanicus]